MSTDVIFIIISLILSAMFSGLEIAFISGSRLKLEITKDSGMSGKLLAIITSDPSKFIATTLVGNTLALSLYGIYMAKVMEPWLATYVANDVAIFILQIVLSTALVLLTAELCLRACF